MATITSDKPPEVPPSQLPDWETPASYDPNPQQHAATATSSRSPLFTFRNRVGGFVDKHLPPHRTYFGRRRRTLLIAVGVVLVLLLALIIGLAVGLSKRAQSKLFLPLPSDTQSFTGDLTYYSPGLGACGVTSSDTDDIVALSHFLFDSLSVGSNPNANPLCGKKLRAERFDEVVNAMRSIDLTVVDRCTGCKPTDLDVSPGVFSQLADTAKGREPVTWAWLQPVPTAAA